MSVKKETSIEHILKQLENKELTVNQAAESIRDMTSDYLDPDPHYRHEFDFENDHCDSDISLITDFFDNGDYPTHAENPVTYAYQKLIVRGGSEDTTLCFGGYPFNPESLRKLANELDLGKMQVDQMIKEDRNQ